MKKKLIGFKRFLNLTLAFLMVVMSIAWNGFTVEAATTTGENLIQNGGFEDVDSSANPLYWTNTGCTRTTTAKEGKYSIVVRDRIEQGVSVEAGQTYELTGYIYMTGVRVYVNLYSYTDNPASGGSQRDVKKLHVDLRESSNTMSEELTFEDENGSVVKTLETKKWYKFSYPLPADTDRKYLVVELDQQSGNTYFDDISLKKVVEEVNVTGITLNKTELALTVGNEETLSATIAPDDATDKTVSWKSTSDAIATVDANGKVTAVGVGSATITVTTTNGKSATCVVTVTAAQTEEPVVSVNGTEYGGTLLEAIAAADTGDTITLRKDINSEEEISLSKGTLDLNGKTLTAPSLIAFEGTDVVDKSESKTGLLKVTTFTPGKDNSQMPIYNGTGYVFIDFEDIVKQEEGSTVSEDVFKLVFKPLFGTTNTALGSLGDGAGVSFRIRLKWTDENDDEQTKDLYWSSDLIKQVYANSMAFSVTASGVSKYKSLTITPLIQSTLNPEIEWLVGTEYSVNPVN